MSVGRTDDASGSHGGFGVVLAGWRERRRMSKRAFAVAMGFDPSYVSHIEAGRHQANEHFVRKAETVLNTNGSLWEAWLAEPGAKTARSARSVSHTAGGLIVEEDHARLHYDGTHYHATQRRRLFNGGNEPVTRYLIRISVDRYPGDPDRSNALYRARPLSWDELDLTARCDDEPMAWQPKIDRESFKEAWLCFDNGQGRFPLYPGQHATLTYSYVVDDERWGPWFQRAVRLPTRRLAVDLVFPKALDPAAWGTETSTTAEAVPFRTPMTRAEAGDQVVFSWATDDPPMSARYRLEWRFRARADDTAQAHPDLRKASDRMKAAGIVQRGEPILGVTARAFDLPAEADSANEVIGRLFAALQRVREHHVFGKGMGLAAPQIGIDRAAAIVIPPDPDAEPLILLNPRVVHESPESDEQYEGCLSFFDVRGMVPRPLQLEVEHTRLDGQKQITVLDTGLARLSGHEIDHLFGRLYTSRMRTGIQPIPVEQYRGTGQAWTYR